MSALLKKLRGSPLLARAVPFILFVALTACQGWLGKVAPYWFYVGKTLFGAWLIWIVWDVVTEMRWRFSYEAVVIGVAVFVMWVMLDDFLRRLGFTKPFHRWSMGGEPWNPHAVFGQDSALAWGFIVTRILGSSLVVPMLEEVFFRSFVYRYIAKPDFQSVPFNRFLPVPFVVTSLVFGFEHREWLAGVLCGFAFQGLVIKKNRLGDAITAHAITNFLLGIWVVGKQAWLFW